ncbi:ORF1 [Anelloviridae sp.]|nr:ORF1 [Anelloviridae sp.]
MWLRRPCITPARMAYRQRWWSRRKRWWRPSTYRRRYRRSAYGFRTRQRKNTYRRRRKVRKTFNNNRKVEKVTQWKPGNIKKVVINGWFPGIASTYVKRTRQWDLDAEQDYQGGGLHTVTFSLYFLYQLHLRHMNWWSQTNDGTDLCRYKGTRLKFWPNDKYSYIVFYDRDFYKNDKFPIYMMHPMLLWLNPNHTTVFSLAIKGNRNPKRVWLPPPAVMTNEWYFQKHFAEYGIFELHLTLFDPENPFTTDTQQNYRTTLGFKPTTVVPPEIADIQPTGYSIFLDDCEGNKMAYNTGADQDPANIVPPGYQQNTMKWIYWGENYPYYVGIWGVDIDKVSDSWGKNIWIWWFPGKGPNDVKPDFKHRKMWIPLNKEQSRALQFSGPFVQKQNEQNINVFFQYRSFWNFGGYTPDWTARHNDNPAIPEYNPDPGPTIAYQQPYQVQIRDPKEVGEGVLHPWDYKEGIIKKEILEAWHQHNADASTSITGQKSTRSVPRPSKGGRKEPDYPTTSDSEEDSDEENPETALPEEHLEKIYYLLGKLLRRRQHH